MKKIAIIGFGGAGYSAAKEARRIDPAARIDVYSDTDTGPYNPMLTTYYVKGAIPYDAMFPFGNLETIEKELNLKVHKDTPVEGLRGAEKTLILKDGREEAYDKILISTGASAIVPPLPGMDLPGVFKMRTHKDAVDFKKALDQGKVKDCLVIGASWVGIKVVEDVKMRGLSCTMVDGAPWIFYAAAFEGTAIRAQKDLESKGVSVHCGQMLSSIERDEHGRLTAVMKSGERFSADLIAVCIGVRTNTAFLKDSGIEVNRGILVDSHMRTNCEDIYAAGDCCEAMDTQSKKTRNIGVWLNAVQQGRVAGAGLAGAEAEFDANVLVNLGHYLNYDFISIGDINGCAPEDTAYEYEDERYYIRGVKKNGRIQCLNVIHSAESNGLLKNIFIKALKSPEAAMDTLSICQLKKKGFPDSFIAFLQNS